MEIVLELPFLPQNRVGPNKLTKSYKTRNPVIQSVKEDFSRYLEENWPPWERPDHPLKSVDIHITFRIQHDLVMDPTNLWGRMKWWEDVLVDEGVLEDDNFMVIKSIRIDRYFVTKDKVGMTWRITGE